MHFSATEGTKRFHNFWAPCSYTWSLEGRSLLVSPLKDYWCPFLRRRRKVEPTLEIKRYPIHEPVSKEYNFLLNLCNRAKYILIHSAVGWILFWEIFYGICIYLLKHVSKNWKLLYLKSVHFKKTVAQSSFLSKMLSFLLKSKQSQRKWQHFWKKWGLRNCLLKMNGL